MSNEMPPGYLGRVVVAFRAASHRARREMRGLDDCAQLIGAFVERFYPVLRHYRADIVGQCLALSYDDPELGKQSQLHGFGSDMKAGDHPHDYESQLGSYRDDGSYLALQAFDYFAGVLR
jgi:hypothetical protein